MILALNNIIKVTLLLILLIAALIALFGSIFVLITMIDWALKIDLVEDIKKHIKKLSLLNKKHVL